MTRLAKSHCRALLAAAAAMWSVIAGPAAAQTPAPPGEPALPPARSDVFFAQLPSAVEGGVIREGMVKRLVDSLVIAASGQPDLASAWRVFVSPKDRVGIKVSTMGAPVSSTWVAVVEAVTEGLVAAGVAPRNIVIWDRSIRNMERAGFGRMAERFRVTATDDAGGYSGRDVVMAPVMGKLIAGDREFGAQRGEQMSGRSHLSPVLAAEVDKVVHVPALADSVFSGVSGALSGMVLDNLDNWRRLARPPHFGDPFLPELYADPRIGGRVVLIILDALRPQFAGGPFPGAQYSVNYGAVFVSRDPVALDACGLRLLDSFRKEASMPLLADKVKWPATAEALGLGHASEEGIRLVRQESTGEVQWKQP